MTAIKQITTYLSIVSVALISSCASEKTVSVRKAKASSGLDKFNANYDYTKDENGLMRATSDQKSQYSRKDQFGGTSRVTKGQDYNKLSYRKKRWGQKSDYSTTQFNGKKDSNYGDSPYYVQQARMNQQRSRFSGNQYGTNNYAIGNATVASGSRRNSSISKGPSGYVSSNAARPDKVVMSREQYSKLNQKKMTVKETNSMLGR